MVLLPKGKSKASSPIFFIGPSTKLVAVPPVVIALSVIVRILVAVVLIIPFTKYNCVLMMTGTNSEVTAPIYLQLRIMRLLQEVQQLVL